MDRGHHSLHRHTPAFSTATINIASYQTIASRSVRTYAQLRKHARSQRRYASRLDASNRQTEIDRRDVQVDLLSIGHVSDNQLHDDPHSTIGTSLNLLLTARLAPSDVITRTDSSLKQVKQLKLEMWGRAQRKASRRCASDWGQNSGEGRVKIPLVATSRVPNAVTLAYTQYAKC